MDRQDEQKRLAARAAAAEVESGMLVGLGTGSTARHAIDAIGERVAAGLAVCAVATSEASAAQARALGIPLLDMADVSAVDLTIDGADEIDDACRAIKGAGGAMVREKIVAAASRRMVVVADATKRVARLGAAPVPLEVLPFAFAFVASAVADMGGEGTRRMNGSAPYRTDGGNPVLDVQFGPIADPAALCAALDALPGVVGHGLFLEEVDAAYIATDSGVLRLERPRNDG